MILHVVTIFPGFFDSPFDYGVAGRARRAGQIEIRVHDLRDFALDRHRTVDDRPFGGDEGMVLKVEPIFRALEHIRAGWQGKRARTIAVSAQGKLFDQNHARRLAACDELVFLCGRYEGFDERVIDYLADEELSAGSFVLSGGEWACGMMADAVARLVPGVVGNEDSTLHESFAPQTGGGVGILDFPHYTRPASFRNWKAPEALLSGHHAQVAKWRRKAALEKTLRNRPDLLQAAELSEEERRDLRLAACGRTDFLGEAP